MKTPLRIGVVAAALLSAVATVPTASAADLSSVKADEPLQTVKVAGFKVDRHAVAGTVKIITANIQLAAASVNVCGAGYAISTGAWRYGTWGTTYTWTNGNTTGPNYEDRPICAVFFNDTGSAHYMGVRLRTNYTSIGPVQNFGTFSSYAGPVYQSKGYCGTVYSYMKAPNGAVVVDNDQTVGACD